MDQSLNNAPGITPPPELLQQWLNEHFGGARTVEVSDLALHLVARAAQWSSDQELEACVQWTIDTPVYYMTPGALRAARRPKPMSLKKRALEAMHRNWNPHNNDDFATIARALEQLDD
jgi:hypothetical protein